MRPLCLAVVIALAPLAGCLEAGGAADAAVYDVPDGGPLPGFRDAGCGGGGTSGTSGAVFHTSGTSGAGCGGDAGGPRPEPPVDADLPDAAPPCDLVTFSYTDASATTVWVTGTWTSWAATPGAGAWELSKGAGDVWTRTGQIGAGKQLYKFIIDGSTWITDPGAPSEMDMDGNTNSVIEVCQGE